MQIGATPDFYCDSAGFEINAYGFSLTLGKSVANPDGGAPGIQPFARAHMSPQHAKVLARLFVMNVKRYEAEFGVIDLPDTVYRSLGLPAEW